MGKPFLIELDWCVSNIDFFVCRRCKTHIASRKDFHFSYAPHDEIPGITYDEVPAVIFTKVVNVEADNPAELKWSDLHLGADVHCITCNEHLGWEFVEVLSEAHPQISEAMVLLTWEKLLIGDGHRLTDA